MHVVHVESVKAVGGQTIRLVEEARYFAAHGPHRFTIVGREGSPFERYARERTDFVPFRFRKPAIWHPANLRGSRRLLAALRPDVVHTHSSEDGWIFGLAARRLGLPIVRGRHISKPLPRSRLGRAAYTHLADAFTVSAPIIGRELERAGLDPRLIYQTPAGLDLERFSPARRDPGFLRAELGLGPGTLLVGTVCNLRTMKGIDLLIRAFDAWLERTRSDAMLVVAGSGDPGRYAGLATFAPERVRFLGFRADVERVLGGLDLLVLASVSREGIPQVVPQAMAIGVPVVSSAAGGLPDVVQDGQTGTLVPVGDVEALSRAIQHACERPASETEALCRRARRLVEAEFPLATIMGRYLAAYEAVLGRSLEPLA